MKKSFFILSLIVLCSLQSGLLAKESVVQRPANLKSQPGEVPENDQFYEGDQRLWPKLKSASKGAVMPAADLAILMKNIEVIHFENEDGILCCGRLNLTNSTITSEAIKSNGTSVLVASNYGQGRAVVLASHLLFEEKTLSGSKNWVFLLRNTIRYAAKTSYAKYQILALGINPSRSFKDLLNRSGLVANITFVWDLNDFVSLSKSQFQVILIGEYSLEFLKATDYQKITQYVTNGGGIITTYRPECQECYIQQTSCPELKRKCLHNTFLNPMGIKLLDVRSGGMISTRSLQYNITDKANLTTVVLRKYERKRPGRSGSWNGGPFLNDYNSLLNGVQKITFPGAYFNPFRYSEESYFPILTKDQQDIMIAGRYGSGRLFFSGHNNIFYRQGTQEQSNKRLFSNILKWLSRNKTSIKVGFLFQNNTDQYTSFQGVSINMTRTGVFRSSELQGKDIICISYLPDWPTGLTQTMLSSLKNYVQNGGNIFFASLAWVWSSYGQKSRNPSLVYQINFAPFVIAKQFNVYLRQSEVELSNVWTLQQNERQSELQSFLQNDMINIFEGEESFSMSDEKLAQYIQRIQAARDIQMICDIQFYHSFIDTFLRSRFNIQTNFDKIVPNNPFLQKVYKVINVLSYAVPAQQCRALPPSLNIYPGCASKIIPNKTVQVYKNRNQRVYPGLYINPGETIRITHNNNIFEVLDVTLVVNHGDDLLVASKNNGNLRRYPDVVRQFPIRSKNFTIASPHGGIIYFRVNKLSNLTTPLLFQIMGAYEAPYFNENMHTPAQFAQIRNIDAPIFVIQAKKFVHIGPTLGVFGSIIIKLSKYCNFWNKVIETYKIFRGISLTPFLKDSIYNDVNLSGGYMHSGYPVMTFQDITLQMLGWKNTIYLQGRWGIYHEFGHNHQDLKWRTSGTKEVTCNIYTLYLLQVMHGIPKQRWLGQFYQEQDGLKSFKNHMDLPIEQRFRSFNTGGIGLYFYYILIDQLGFEIFSKLHKKYDTLTNLSLPNDAAKYEVLVEQISLVTELNLWDYFYNWGMPVTEASRQKVSHLDTYRCSRHPQLTPE